MSEQIENTQPTSPLDPGETQPSTPASAPSDTQPRQDAKPRSRWKSILIGLLVFLVIVGLGGFSGYRTGINDRVKAENKVISAQLLEQYQYALVDIQFGRYDAARQRLDFIISEDPSFPGAQDKLTEVLVLSTIPTATLTPTLTPTPDLRGIESAFERAQQLIQAQDWAGALSALDTARKLDPGYKTAQVDGMYYFALRNQGYDLITKQGNLEGGIYYLTLAERFGPLDNTAIGMRESARLYITGASFWELDWAQAVNYFSQVNAGWPSMWDGTMYASDRFRIASMRFGDQLFLDGDYCAAYDQYLNAQSVGNLDETATINAYKSQLECYPPTADPGVIGEATPTTEP